MFITLICTLILWFTLLKIMIQVYLYTFTILILLIIILNIHIVTYNFFNKNHFDMI